MGAAYQLFHDGILALARAERQGIRVDVEYCQRKQEQITRRIEHYENKIAQMNLYKRWTHIYRDKVNIYSNHQLSNILYKHMKLTPPKTTEGGQGSTDEETLRQFDLPELRLILQVRKLAKVRDTYLGSFVRETGQDGYMHPSFNLHTVKTYRSSSSDPNFQNIPKRDKEAMRICRRAVLPRPGHMLVEADFAALEVMIAACYCKDPVLIEYLKDKQSDMHLDMAKQIFMFDTLDRQIPTHALLRTAAKNGFVFPQFYGDYYANNARGLCEWTGLPARKWNDEDGILLPTGEHIGAHLRRQGVKSFEKFADHIQQVEDDFWNRRFRVYNQWRKNWVEKYRRRGYLKMLTGFTCSGVMSKNEILNYPIQGSAFHCLLMTFVKLDQVMQEENWDSRLVGQIHDSIVLDVRPDELPRIEAVLHKIVRQELPSIWPWIIVPLEIEVEAYDVDGPWLK